MVRLCGLKYRSIMKKTYTLLYFLLFFLSIIFEVESQNLTPEELLKSHTYIRYSEAHKVPEKVYKLCVSEMSRIPDDFDKLKKLQFLTIGVDSKDIEFNFLPNHFYSIKSLKHLAIENTSLDSIGSQISNLTNLEFLSIKKNKIRKINPAISVLEKLDTLYAGDAILPKEMTKMNLRVLQTSRPKIPIILTLEELIYDGDSIPQNLGRFPNLKKVILTHSKLRADATLAQIQTNKKISFIGINALACKEDNYAWEKLSRMDSLKVISITNVNVFSRELLKIKNLTEVRLYGFLCRNTPMCKGIFDNLAQLPKIKTLVMDRFSSELHLMHQIECLKIEDSRDFKKLDGSQWLSKLYKFPELKFLSLEKTDLSEAKNIRFDSLQKVTHLNIAFTKLSNDPLIIESIGKMPSLNYLVISNQEFEIISCGANFSSWKKLKELIIYNRQSDIAPGIPELCKTQISKLLPGVKITYYE